MTKIIIDREKWLHKDVRNVLQTSMLQHPGTGLQCCLGQYAEQCGVSPLALENRAMPHHLDNVDRERVASELLSYDEDYDAESSVLAYKISSTNDGNGDTKDLTIAEREQRLVELFANMDVELVFKGDHTVAVTKALDYMSSLGDNLP